MYDPVAYFLGALQLRFANLEEESRLQSMTEMLAFARRQGEDINALLTRYEVVRQRAANEGRFVRLSPSDLTRRWLSCKSADPIFTPVRRATVQH